MKKMNYQVTIDSPVDHVFKTMLDKETYKSGQPPLTQLLTLRVAGKRVPRFILQASIKMVKKKVW
ncbi:hypothetical protein KUH03_06020 [Sphingobacterium sp. E70]|uniref:hypothetical protein n=1 Tax=Sphingobacterium sp. E70 TaxID=2853439 RepID=UPI00211CAA12|nr:hypothetical protein [Sphingobacterium sp. E70]ULT26450.1 hypothetical protein KUH03_06020 [Sphingobacterium sp. E70]